MGNEQSKTPHDPLNPRRLRDIVKIEEFNQMIPQLPDKELFDAVMNFTAPEFKVFTMGMLMMGMSMCMNDQDRGKKLQKSWNAHIKVVNQTNQTISVSMHLVDWQDKTKMTFEGEISIEAWHTGRLPLPTDVNFERDFPLSPILNCRTLIFVFGDGEQRKCNCSILNNGLHKSDLVVKPDKTFYGCEEMGDAVLTPEQEEEGEWMRDFMAESSDPLCAEVSDERSNEIQAIIQRCLPESTKTN
jgi:hypothetical protein